MRTVIRKAFIKVLTFLCIWLFALCSLFVVGLGALEEIFEPALNEAIKLNLLAEVLMEVA
jgi:hypothetical protein